MYYQLVMIICLAGTVRMNLLVSSSTCLTLNIFSISCCGTCSPKR